MGVPIGNDGDRESKLTGANKGLHGEPFFFQSEGDLVMQWELSASFTVGRYRGCGAAVVDQAEDLLCLGSTAFPKMPGEFDECFDVTTLRNTNCAHAIWKVDGTGYFASSIRFPTRAGLGKRSQGLN